MYVGTIPAFVIVCLSSSQLSRVRDLRCDSHCAPPPLFSLFLSLQRLSVAAPSGGSRTPSRGRGSVDPCEIYDSDWFKTDSLASGSNPARARHIPRSPQPHRERPTGMEEVIRLKSRFVSAKPGEGSAGHTVSRGQHRKICVKDIAHTGGRARERERDIT